MSKVPMPELLANSLTLGQRASLDRWVTAYGDARAAEARREALEEAAAILDSVDNHSNPLTARDCANAIRALAQQAEPPKGER